MKINLFKNLIFKKEKNVLNWYISVILWAFIFATSLNWAVVHFSSGMGEGGLFWFLIGLAVIAPFFITPVVLFSLIMSVIKFLKTHLVEYPRMRKLLYVVFYLSIPVSALLLFVILSLFYADSSLNMFIVIPWPIFGLLFMFVLFVTSKVFNIKKPKLWTDIVSPVMLGTLIFLSLSPLLFVGWVYVNSNGFACSLSISSKLEKTCEIEHMAQTTKSMNVCDVYSGDKKDMCLYRFAIKSQDISNCNFLSDDEDTTMAPPFSYSKRDWCEFVIIYQGGRNCEALLNNENINACNVAFEQLKKQDEWEKNESSGFYEKLLQKI